MKKNFFYIFLLFFLDELYYYIEFYDLDLTDF